MWGDTLYTRCWYRDGEEPGQEGYCTCQQGEICWRLLRPEFDPETGIGDWVIVEHKDLPGTLLPGLLYAIEPDTVTLYFACKNRSGLVLFSRHTGREFGPGEYMLPPSMRVMTGDELGALLLPEEAA